MLGQQRRQRHSSQPKVNKPGRGGLLSRPRRTLVRRCGGTPPALVLSGHVQQYRVLRLPPTGRRRLNSQLTIINSRCNLGRPVPLGVLR